MQSSILSGFMFIMSALIFLTQVSVEGVDLSSSKEEALIGFTYFQTAIYLLLCAIFFKE